jgi:hypothetical protein
MLKAEAIILSILIGFPIMLSAQDESENPSNEPGWDYYYDDMFTRGDQTFIITLGTIFPTVFLHNGEKINHNISPPIGGTGSLSYNYYLTNHIFAGAEVMGMFLYTLGGNPLFIIPLGARAGYQFNVWRFEIPLNMGMGMVWHRYLNSKYYGFYLKGGASAFFRATLSWSFGINTNWYWLPEWTSDKSMNVYGNVLDITLSARYHF